MSFKIGDVLDSARVLLNDSSGDVYTNPDLLPLFRIGYDDLRQELQSYNIPITNSTTKAIAINQGMKDIGGPTGPALPRDLVSIEQCWERTAGTSDDMMLMQRVQYLPKTDILTAFLQVWEWSKQYVHFLGANSDIEVKLDYTCTGLGPAIDSNTIVNLINGQNFLNFRTGALASRYIGENTERADELDGEAGRALDTLLSSQVKNSSGIVTRRRPFMANYKQRGGGTYSY